MSRHLAVFVSLISLAAVLAGAPAPGARAGDPLPGGSFRFLVDSLPDGTTNGEYVATLLVANAAGPVTFGSIPSAPAPGLSLDARTGLISGIPTEVDGSGFDVTFTADDGATTIQLVTRIKVNSSGGGGNSGVSFATESLPVGRVGNEYTGTIGLLNSVGPVVFTAADLPPGLSLHGATGTITGTPQAAGTFYVTLSATDRGENDNKVVTIIPLDVRPPTSEFRFETFLLNNGEVGTAYCDTWVTSDGSGAVSYSASGLPGGLAVEPSTGVVTGTPEEAGLFVVTLVARDATDAVSVNRPLRIVPSSTSSFLWELTGLPAALVDVPYTRQPPLLVVTKNGTDVSYAATGLPAGIDYDGLTGELRGAASEVGIYPVRFVATSGTGEVLAFSVDFLVLPPGGGDAGSLAANAWATSLRLRPGDGDGSWTAAYVYNADRRSGNAFDPELDTLTVELGSRPLVLPPGTLVAKGSKLRYRSEKGVEPRVSVQLDQRSQSLRVKTSRDVLTDAVPAALRNTVVVGNKGNRLELTVDDRGRFKAALGYRRPAFVVSSVKAQAKPESQGKLTLGFLLGDPAADVGDLEPVVRIRLTHAGSAVVDRDLGALLTRKDGTDRRTGLATFTLKRTEKDLAPTDVVKRFAWSSKTGRATLSLRNVDLTPLAPGEAQLGVELTFGERTWFTSVTLFEGKPGRYSDRMP